jgi:hypothetical protein
MRQPRTESPARAAYPDPPWELDAEVLADEIVNAPTHHPDEHVGAPLP